MGKSLIIVESPAKVKTIKKFLGPGYLVQASVGHIRDLPKSNIGVDEANDFAPEYEIIQGKEKVVQSLRDAASKVDTVFLAPDRPVSWREALLHQPVQRQRIDAAGGGYWEDPAAPDAPRSTAHALQAIASALRDLPPPASERICD